MGGIQGCSDSEIAQCGVVYSPDGLVMDSRPETIRKSIEGSLRRLQIEYVDLYYQHRIDPKVELE